MLILEELWERTPALRGVPIYQASGQAKRALSIFQTYVEMMNDDIRRAFQVRCSMHAAPCWLPVRCVRGAVRWQNAICYYWHLYLSNIVTLLSEAACRHKEPFCWLCGRYA